MNTCGFNFDRTYTQLPEIFYTELLPEAVPAPELKLFNSGLAQSMGLDFSAWTDAERAELFCGHRLPDGATPLCLAYAGHQFGHFVVLGDGRAHLWGEHLTPTGARLDLQFKGSGRTPYSRRGDGKAALGPMLREYLISEDMHHLGIPSTRSLAVVTTGENVVREECLPGAILTRVASSHIRVGTFELAAQQADSEGLESLLNYTLQRHYPSLLDSRNQALALIEAVMERQVALIVQWMRVGFIHGVMNTDNMALSGETIDYGPCAFMDAYDPNTVFSSIDHMGRYAYANQPKIAHWNLCRLAEALLPLIHQDEAKAVDAAQELLSTFPALYELKWLSMMRAKLGLVDVMPGDAELIAELLKWMRTSHADYTNTFSDLSGLKQSCPDWYHRWQARSKKDSQSCEAQDALMRRSNPLVIPRNHKVEQALEAATGGDFTVLRELMAVLESPYSKKGCIAPYQAPPEPGERVYQTFCGT
jgi:uncharacterized protein YdiU (UPF0061 family)